MIVRLPATGVSPWTPRCACAFLEAAAAAKDEERKTALDKHAQNVRAHMNQLAARSYWEQLEPAPEFVCCFFPASPSSAPRWNGPHPD